mgnify:CR=1 FL=1
MNCGKYYSRLLYFVNCGSLLDVVGNWLFVKNKVDYAWTICLGAFN